VRACTRRSRSLSSRQRRPSDADRGSTIANNELPHAISADASALGVDPTQGLCAVEAERRALAAGPNAWRIAREIALVAWDGVIHDPETGPGSARPERKYRVARFGSDPVVIERPRDGRLDLDDAWDSRRGFLDHLRRRAAIDVP
jgi:hypothetical protein